MAFSFDEVAKFENTVWSRCAPGYREGFEALTGNALKPLLDAVNVRKGERVLDLGCGPGTVSAAAQERGASCVGVDFSDAMVGEARRRNPGIDFKTGDVHALPFGDAEFDVVIANLVVHHLGDPDRALKEAQRVLKPGGRLAFTVWADMTKLEAFGLFFGAVAEHGNAGELPHGPLFGVSDFDVYRTMVKKAGFSDSTVREVPIAWKTDSIDSYLKAFSDWAAMDTFPKATADAIRTSVRTKAEAYRKGSGFEIPNPVILVFAIK